MSKFVVLTNTPVDCIPHYTVLDNQGFDTLEEAIVIFNYMKRKGLDVLLGVEDPNDLNAINQPKNVFQLPTVAPSYITSVTTTVDPNVYWVAVVTVSDDRISEEDKHYWLDKSSRLTTYLDDNCKFKTANELENFIAEKNFTPDVVIETLMLDPSLSTVSCTIRSCNDKDVF